MSTVILADQHFCIFKVHLLSNYIKAKAPTQTGLVGFYCLLDKILLSSWNNFQKILAAIFESLFLEITPSFRPLLTGGRETLGTRRSPQGDLCFSLGRLILISLYLDLMTVGPLSHGLPTDMLFSGTDLADSHPSWSPLNAPLRHLSHPCYHLTRPCNNSRIARYRMSRSSTYQAFGAFPCCFVVKMCYRHPKRQPRFQCVSLPYR